MAFAEAPNERRPAALLSAHAGDAVRLRHFFSISAFQGRAMETSITEGLDVTTVATKIAAKKTSHTDAMMISPLLA
ncbi:MAG: hypothetical protein ACXWC5_21065 [Burkholderiales bacterium]